MNFALAVAAWTVPTLLLAVALSAAGKATLRWRWLLVGAGLYAVYGLLSYLTLPAAYLDMPAEQRWLSRLSALAVSLVAIGKWVNSGPVFEREALGLTLRQAPGSLPASILGLGVLVAISALPGGIGWNPAGIDAGAVAYHLTVPGLEEELMYRAVLPAIFALGLSARMEDARKYLGWGLAMGVIAMACGHAFTLRPGGQISFDVFSLFYVGLIGAILADMRYRSGSLLFPIIGHNLVGLFVRIL